MDVNFIFSVILYEHRVSYCVCVAVLDFVKILVNANVTIVTFKHISLGDHAIYLPTLLTVMRKNTHPIVIKNSYNSGIFSSASTIISDRCV